MNKKKKNMIFMLIALIIILVIIVNIIKNGGTTKTIELNYTGREYAIDLSVPEGKGKGTSKYVIKTGKDNPTQFSDCSVVGDKVQISFEQASHVFHTSEEYQEEHGEIRKPTFKQFKEYYLKDPYNNNGQIKDVTEIKIGNRPALRYKYMNKIVVVANTEDISYTPIFIDITPVNKEEDIDNLIKAEEFKKIFESIEIKKVD